MKYSDVDLLLKLTRKRLADARYYGLTAHYEHVRQRNVGAIRVLEWMEIRLEALRKKAEGG